MTNQSSLEKCLKDLVNSNFPKTQMDVFYKGQVVLHVFNQSDVSTWNFKLPLHEEGGIVINLFFNDRKLDNEENHQRFKGASFFGDFILRKMHRGKISSYYLPVSKSVSQKNAANSIIEILSTVYQIEADEPLEIFVRVYS